MLHAMAGKVSPFEVLKALVTNPDGISSAPKKPNEVPSKISQGMTKKVNSKGISDTNKQDTPPGLPKATKSGPEELLKGIKELFINGTPGGAADQFNPNELLKAMMTEGGITPKALGDFAKNINPNDLLE